MTQALWNINDKIENFLKRGYLYNTISMEMQSAKYRLENKNKEKFIDWPILHQKAYIKWKNSMDTVKDLFVDLTTNNRYCDESFEKRIPIEGGYRFWRGDYLGKHLISIDNSYNMSYWTIGVKYDGIFQGNENNRITGFYHVGTNLNLDEMIDIVSKCKNLFPKVYHTDPLYMTQNQVIRFLSNKSKCCYICKNNDQKIYKRCDECFAYKCKKCYKQNIHWDNGKKEQWKKERKRKRDITVEDEVV